MSTHASSDSSGEAVTVEVPAAERHVVQANLPAWRMLKNLQVRAQEDASEALYKKLADKMQWSIGYDGKTKKKTRAE